MSCAFSAPSQTRYAASGPRVGIAGGGVLWRMKGCSEESASAVFGDSKVTMALRYAPVICDRPFPARSAGNAAPSRWPAGATAAGFFGHKGVPRTLSGGSYRDRSGLGVSCLGSCPPREGWNERRAGRFGSVAILSAEEPCWFTPEVHHLKQPLKSRLGAHQVESWVRLDEHHFGRVLIDASIEPFERFRFLAKPKVHNRKIHGRYVLAS